MISLFFWNSLIFFSVGVTLANGFGFRDAVSLATHWAEPVLISRPDITGAR